MYQNYQAQEWHRNQGTYLLNWALRSSSISFGSVLGTLVIGFIWGAILGSNAPKPIKILFGLPVPIAIGYTLLKFKDTEQDWRTWDMHNQPERRIKVIDQTFQSNLAAYRNHSFQVPTYPVPRGPSQQERLQELQYKSQLKVWERQQLQAQAAQEQEPEDEPPYSTELFDPTRLLAQDPMSTLVAGVPSSGKGIVVSNALRELMQLRPDIQITVLDPKADPKETGYWDLGSQVTVHRFNGLQRPAPDLRDWILGELESFLLSTRAPRLLVLDELSMVMATLGTLPAKESGIPELKEAIAKIVSIGDSHEAWIWCMGQSVQVKDLGLSGGFRSMLRSIGLVSLRNTNAVQSFLRTDFVDNIGLAQVREVCELSPVNRAVYDGTSATWYPMAQLQNHSGYDRDRRSQIQEPRKQEPLPPEALDLLEYLNRKPKMNRRSILKRWACARGHSAVFTDSLIEILESRSLIKKLSDGCFLPLASGNPDV